MSCWIGLGGKGGGGGRYLGVAKCGLNMMLVQTERTTSQRDRSSAARSPVQADDHGQGTIEREMQHWEGTI